MAKLLSKKEYAKKKQAEMKETINEAMDEVTNHTKNPKEFIEYLDFMSKMYDYSPRNQMLLNRQYSGAEGIAGKKQFEEMGFNVNENEKPLKVLAPVFKKYTIDDNKKWIPLDRPNKEQQSKIDSGEYKVKRKLAYYRFANVYDICQTDAKADDYPKMFPNRPYQFDESTMNEKHPKLKDAIRSFAEKEGYQLHDEADTNRLGKAKGMYAPATHSVYMRPHLSEGEYLNTLNHEIAHGQLHKSSQLDRPTKELEAEMTAYVTNKHFNLDTSEKAIDYMATWTNNLSDIEDKEKIKVIERVSKASRNMITGIEKEYESKIEKSNEKSMDAPQVADNNKKAISMVQVGDMTFNYNNLKDEHLQDFTMVKDADVLDVQFNDNQAMNIYSTPEEKAAINQYKSVDVQKMDLTVDEYMQYAMDRKNGVEQSQNIDKYIEKNGKQQQKRKEKNQQMGFEI